MSLYSAAANSIYHERDGWIHTVPMPYAPSGPNTDLADTLARMATAARLAADLNAGGGRTERALREIGR